MEKFQEELRRAQNEGLFQSGPVFDFLSKTCPSISALDDGDITPFNGQLVDPRHRIEEILRSILRKSRGFLTVGITGHCQAKNVSRIHPLDIIMLVLGLFSESRT